MTRPIDWPAIERLYREWRPTGFVVGDPMTLDGGDQPIRERARAFAHAQPWKQPGAKPKARQM